MQAPAQYGQGLQLRPGTVQGGKQPWGMGSALGQPLRAPDSMPWRETDGNSSDIGGKAPRGLRPLQCQPSSLSRSPDNHQKDLGGQEGWDAGGRCSHGGPGKLQKLSPLAGSLPCPLLANGHLCGCPFHALPRRKKQRC